MKMTFRRWLCATLAAAALWSVPLPGRGLAQGVSPQPTALDPAAQPSSPPASGPALPVPPPAAELVPPGNSWPAAFPASLGPPAAPIIASPDAVFGDLGGRGDMFGGMWGPPAYRLGYSATWFSDEEVTQQATHLGYVEQNFSFSMPLWHDDVNVWSANVGVRQETFSTAAILPDTKQPFPEELWSIRFGTSFRHQFDNGWSENTSISLGSASDQPFASTDRVAIGFNEMVRVPQGEHNAWLFSLSYSNNSELAFPVPGIAYLWQPSDQFRATLGVPFSMRWRPREDLIIDASFALLRNVHARATYAIAPPVKVFAAFDWGDEAWFLSDRPANDDRFYYNDKKLSAGVQWPLTPSASLELSSGYVFQRFYYEGETSFSDRFSNRLDVAPGTFLMLQLRTRF